ncbi:hypothetical protein JTE90_020859 [Oedothorax gibbosus]|uniref:Scm-like with four MBT domains protein 1 n=1 Tax=Oedothorax gibbosus TaxID=931172 RepID=A0AAV6UTH2_9ARAC|nr:hypothetical protein JTE90_020859 [Oedothorax gibbosus]
MNLEKTLVEKMTYITMGEGEFWPEYLEATETQGVDATAFTHVEHSLDSGLKIGMKLEIPNPDDNSTYWLASVRMICGDLLLIRTAGYNDSSGDSWLNVKENEFHEIGWCSSNKKKLIPPKKVLEKHPDLDSLISKELRNAQIISTCLYNDLKSGVLPIDKIKCGMKLEIEESYTSQRIWIATVMKNVGGRLLLKYDGSKEDSQREIWLFYLDDRLHLAEYGQENNLQYCPPDELKAHLSDEEWKNILKKSLKEAKENPFPARILEPRVPLKKHKFEIGMKLEAVNTLNFTDICPATVTQILDDFHFLITMDSFQEDGPSSTACCHSNYPYIFPINWAETNGLDLKTPKGYESKFLWNDYLKSNNAKAAPKEFFSEHLTNAEFQVSNKLEAADPFSLGDIKAATVVKVVDPLIWLHFDNEESDQNTFIRSMKSFNMFPVGWCASNSYPLQTPKLSEAEEKMEIVEKEVKNVAQKSSQEASTSSPTGHLHSKSWCPKIYFNHRCFTGPLLSKSKLAELPQAIGPGPLQLVIKDVIYRVVNIAYKSSRVLQILQGNGKSNVGMEQQLIKAKYKGKIFRATIDVIRNSEQVEEFCKNICLKLECCPYLFGPKHVGETCPNDCHTQTKTKFGYNFVKKKNKVGRPPSNSSSGPSENNGETIVKRGGPGRKKKKQHWKHLLSMKLEELDQKAQSRDSSETDERVKPIEQRPNKIPLVGKKKLKHTPSSSIVTRGAKLPNFGLWHHVSPFHARRGRPRTRPIRPPLFPPRKVGRPVGSTKKNLNAARKKEKEDEIIDVCGTRSPSPVEEDNMSSSELPSIPKPTLLQSNPLEWSVEDVVQYLQKTDYAPLAPLLKEQEIDGQALLMLNLCSVQQYLHLKPEPAEKFCYLIKNLKIEFFNHYVT